MAKARVKRSPETNGCAADPDEIFVDCFIDCFFDRSGLAFTGARVSSIFVGRESATTMPPRIQPQIAIPTLSIEMNDCAS